MAQTYTEAEREAYKRGLAAAKGKGGRSSSSKAKGARKKFDADNYKPSNGCFYEESYKDGKTGKEVNKPRIWGYRGRGSSFAKLSCFLKGDGKPANPKDDASAERYLIFVCNLTGQGGLPTATGIWDTKHRYMRVPDWDLVIKPFTKRKHGKGGYFGPGGSYFKDKV